MDQPPALRDAARRRDVGTVVRLARQRLLMTQAQLAAALGYSQAAISRIERGSGGAVHDVRTLRSLADALEIPGALLGLADQPSEDIDPMRRRDFLRATTTAAALTATGDVLVPGRIGRSDLAHLHETIEDLRVLDRVTGGDRLHRLAAIHTREIRTLLVHATYSNEVGQQLSGILGEATILAGWLAFDANRPDDAIPQYTEAITAAGSADDPLVAAHAYANLSMLALSSGQAQRAVQFAQAGQRSAVRSGGPRLRSLLLAREARAQAVVGNHSAVADVLARADRAFTTSHGVDPGWTDFFTQAELSGATGLALQTMGDIDSATIHLRDAARLVGSSRNQASWILSLSECLAVGGEYDQAFAVVSDVVPMIVDLRSTRVRRHFRDVSKTLLPHLAKPDRQQLQDRLSALDLAS